MVRSDLKAELGPEEKSLALRPIVLCTSSSASATPSLHEGAGFFRHARGKHRANIIVEGVDKRDEQSWAQLDIAGNQQFVVGNQLCV